MPYPAARENPESTPCVRKLRGSSEGVREAAKNIVPRRRPLVENECHGPLSMWPPLSIAGERQLRPAACRGRPDGASREGQGNCRDAVVDAARSRARVISLMRYRRHSARRRGRVDLRLSYLIERAWPRRFPDARSHFVGSDEVDSAKALALLGQSCSRNNVCGAHVSLVPRKGAYVMARREILDRIEKYVDPFRITQGKRFQLENFDPADTCGLRMDKGEAADLLQRGTEWLAEEQDMLYAQDRWSLLLVFQAMDAAGKDGTIKHVMSGVNPQGCQFFSFKQPSREDLDHDFLWRYAKCLPERGRIGIFNRSYYEEVLVVRVHEQILKQQKLPSPLVSKRIWGERLLDLAHFEDYLTRQGTIVLKFFLNVSRKEQKKRFMERLDNPQKHWKFSPADVRERGFWTDYMHAFEQAIRATASKHAPWFVVPADNKWFTRLLVAAAIVEAVEKLDLEYPMIDAEKKKQLKAMRAALSRDK